MIFVEVNTFDFCEYRLTVKPSQSEKSVCGGFSVADGEHRPPSESESHRERKTQRLRHPDTQTDPTRKKGT